MTGQQENSLSRRSVLILPCAAALSVSTVSNAIESELLPPTLDLRDPADNLTAVAKIEGDISGKTVYAYGSGHCFGITDEAMAAPMMRYESCRIGRHIRQDDGSFLFKFRGMIAYKDYDTDKFIDDYYNPYTKKTVSVRHWKTSAGVYSYTDVGTKGPDSFTGNAGRPYGEPFRPHWGRAGDSIWVSLDHRVEYLRSSDNQWRRDNAIERYQTNWNELMDPNLTATSASSSFQTHIEWFSWLGMDGYKGGIMQGGVGKKLFNPNDLPQTFIDYMEKWEPGIIYDKIDKS